MKDAVLQWLLVLGAVLVVATPAALWLLARSRKRRHHQHHRHHRHSVKPSSDLAVTDNPRPRHGHHRRHRGGRHEHLPTNPTLAETGGLPPVRGAGSSPAIKN